MKIMAIDFGTKRVGIASTDESGRFALPRLVLPNTPDLVEKVLEFKNQNEIERVVVGESKNLKGEPNSVMSEVNQLCEELRKRGVDVVLHPEIFTTMEARQIQGNTSMTDASAAALILKNYLDSNN